MADDLRRLAAIMFTDIVGYSASAQTDESTALVRLREHEELVRPVVAEFRGREIKSTGDGLLVEFDSALKATQCAIEIQRRIHERSAHPAVTPFRIRIGIHLGDVEQHGGDIFGDAVNIAARLEPLADPGGVCLSQQVVDQVRNKIPNRFEKLPPKPLKNMPLAIDVYRVVLPWQISATPTEPSGSTRLAVLPFSNISPDPNDGYFADGITDELISTLSRLAGLRVISRTSVMRYKNTTKSLGEIASELRVGSILEGSVRKVSDELRITAQLIDASTDEHLWSEDYDTRLKEVFRVQKEIATSVARALQVRLLSSEKKEIGKTATQSAPAYLEYIKGRQHWNARTREGNAQAVVSFEEALRLDGAFALAYAGLADCYLVNGDWGWMSPQEAFPRAKGYILRALELDPNLAEPHASLAAVYNSYEGNWSEAEREYQRAIELKPSYAIAHMWYALLLLGEDRFTEAEAQLDRFRELDPLSWLFDVNRGYLLSYRGERTAAIDQFRALVEKVPDRPHGHSALAVEYLLAGRKGEALSELRVALSLPGSSPSVRAEIACALAIAGLNKEAEEMLESVQGASGAESAPRPLSIVEALMALGRVDEGFGRLESARKEGLVYLNHASNLSELRRRPWFAEMRQDPRWAAFEQALELRSPSKVPGR